MNSATVATRFSETTAPVEFRTLESLRELTGLWIAEKSGNSAFTSLPPSLSGNFKIL